MVVLTRQLVDPGNEICELDDREQAIAYFEQEAGWQQSTDVLCPRRGWERPQSQY